MKDDEERRIQAEEALAHMKDQQRLIDARKPVISKIVGILRFHQREQHLDEKLDGFIEKAERFTRGE